jgi:DNA repair protein RadC
MFSPYTVRTILVREGNVNCAYALGTPKEVYNLFGHLDCDDRESFVVVMLDIKQRITDTHLVSTGSLDASIVHPREVFKAAVVANAAAIILVHNHPSGDYQPSKEDHEVTERLAAAGKILGIQVLDHVIIGSGGYYSFRDKNII